jgi:chaperone modulatory protein CbpM
MTPQETPVLTGLIVEEQTSLSLEEISGICAVEERRMVELVEEGVIEMRSVTETKFSGEVLRRARIAVRLQRDLGLNAAGIAVALELLDRIESLERRLQRGDV